MSFYNLVLKGSAGGNAIENAFQYDTTSLLPSNEEANDLSVKFVADILSKIKPFLHNSTSWQSVYITAPYTPDVFSLGIFTPGSQVGAISGDALPRYNAWAIQCPRRVRNINSGAKRFSVVAEATQAGGVPIATTLTAITALCTALNTPMALDWGAGSAAAVNIIVKRIKYTTPDGKTAYRIPQGTDPYQFYVADRWVFDDMTTQNTRKSGRGV